MENRSGISVWHWVHTNHLPFTIPSRIVSIKIQRKSLKMRAIWNPFSAWYFLGSKTTNQRRPRWTRSNASNLWLVWTLATSEKRFGTGPSPHRSKWRGRGVEQTKASPRNKMKMRSSCRLLASFSAFKILWVCLIAQSWVSWRVARWSWSHKNNSMNFLWASSPLCPQIESNTSAWWMKTFNCFTVRCWSKLMRLKECRC